MKSLIIFIFVCILLSGCGDSSIEPESNDFAIYLSRGRVLEIPADINDIELEDSPLFNLNDIVSYNWSNHEIELTEDAVNRINSSELKMYQKNFVVTVSGERIYAGYIWSMISSLIVASPIINVAPAGYGTDYDLIEKVIRIQQAYPTNEFALYIDPRGNEKIRSVLKAAGKLIE